MTFAAVAFSLLCLFCSGSAASAVDMPYVVIGENIWLLDRENGAKLFLLPESYYARIDNMDESYYYVTFNGVAGKVDKTSVSTTGYPAEADGTLKELRIDPKYSVFTEIKLKSNMENGEDIPVPVSADLLFLGKYPADEMYYYVKCGEIRGYIGAGYTTVPELEIPTFSPVKDEPEELPKKDEKEKNGNNLIKILVITGLSVVLVVLLIIIFRPRKKGANKYYYEDIS